MVIYGILTIIMLFFGQFRHGKLQASRFSSTPKVLASETYSLQDRYNNQWVNNVFADNILLTYAYLSGQVKNGQQIDWDQVHAPSTYQFELQPGKTFAFHNDVLDQYKNTVTQTTNAQFTWQEGFKSDGYLVGDGVCHFASFINVVSSQAGLKVDAPTKHDFAAIPDVDKKFGTAIYYMPNEPTVSDKQNLYVTNTTNKPIAFVFTHTQSTLEISVESD